MPDKPTDLNHETANLLSAYCNELLKERPALTDKDGNAVMDGDKPVRRPLTAAELTVVVKWMTFQGKKGDEPERPGNVGDTVAKMRAEGKLSGTAAMPPVSEDD